MERIKYPRTKNLPWSQSNSSDDVWWSDTSLFDGQEVVVTEKMDGECTTIYADGYVHARSVDSKHHPSRSWIKALAANLHPMIPSDWRVCGENINPPLHQIQCVPAKPSPKSWGRRGTGTTGYRVHDDGVHGVRVHRFARAMIWGEILIPKPPLPISHSLPKIKKQKKHAHTRAL